MTVLPDKARLYLAEAWFREGWADLVRLGGIRAPSLTHEHALLLFKPDAVVARAIVPALEHLEDAGFAPVAAEPVEWNRHLTRALWLYRFNVASVERMALHDLILFAGPSLLVVLRDLRLGDGDPVPASVRLTAAKGPSRPERRRPDHLRSVLGVTDRMLNLFHTADEPADLVRELAIFLPARERRELIARVLAGSEGMREVRAAVDSLYAQAPRCDFDLNGALERVSTAARRRAAASEDEDERERWELVAGRAAVARAGSREERLELWTLLRELDPDIDRWERAVIGTWTIDHDEVGDGQQTLGDAPPQAWQAFASRNRF
jgi:hypothetical protein